MDAARRHALSHHEMPSIASLPQGTAFHVAINGCSIRECLDEHDADHCGKHAFEAVNDGLRTPRDIAAAMNELCRQATALNLHT